ncbi:MAG: membrane protein insertion efficiency factor YidD [Epsilonproteobacteria bacterium]|nr:membrane protein insertion efficiency factor YidD [Campylobacterota bacterium]
MGRVPIKIIGAYQYISALFPASCRYYPTCSEYAKWQFKFNRFDRAIINSAVRILRCNQLFRGGIDYPIIKYRGGDYLTLSKYRDVVVEYWLVPKSKEEFYLIKSF